MSSKIKLILLSLFLALQLNAQDSLTFVIKNAGINVDGIFKEHTITQKFNANQLDQAEFKATIEVESLDTGIGARDRHLKKEKYFDLEKYPTISFQSTRIMKEAKGFLMTGELKIKGTQRIVEIPFEIVEVNGRQKFKGKLTIDRRDYGVGKNHLFLADEVEIYLSILNRNSL